MGKINSILNLAFVLLVHSSVAFAAGPSDAAKCYFDGQSFDLKLVWESTHNPEYLLEASLPKEMKAALTKEYLTFGVNTFRLKVISKNKTILENVLNLNSDLTNRSDTLTYLGIPILSIDAEVTYDSEIHHIKCEFIHPMNKEWVELLN